ncbi:MAG: hypothetical protein HWE34_16930 [Methylocystaceae bacterium]|nr:hypothetical protein [Methylocystaceae bacterium]
MKNRILLENYYLPDDLEAQIDTPTRILTIADIFQALCQERPYRDRFCANEVLSIMDGMADKGQIDLKIYNLLKVNVDEFYKTAIWEG